MTDGRRPVALALPALGDEEIASLARVIRSGWVTQGPEVQAFEEELARSVSAAHAVATTSATTALHLALLASGVGPGDEVVVPTMSFIASANAVRHAGATPVLCDVDPRSFNLTAETAERAIGPRTRALLAVHQVGLPCDLDELRALADDRGLALVEDAACAIGASYRGAPIGRGRSSAEPAAVDLGRSAPSPIGAPRSGLVCFSFHPRKVITTGEGGMITLDDAEQAARLRRLRHHGMSISDVERHRSGGAVVERYDELGWNYRMTDLQAAIGRAQLDRLPTLVAQRRRLAARYAAALEGMRATAPLDPPDRVATFQSYQLVLDEGIDREGVIAALAREAIASRRGLMLIHRERPYRDQRGPFPGAESIAERTLLLPLHHALTDEDQDRVIDSLRRAILAAA